MKAVGESRTSASIEVGKHRNSVNFVADIYIHCTKMIHTSCPRLPNFFDSQDETCNEP